MTKITTRADARAAGLTRYFTGKACRLRGHVKLGQYVCNYKCVECERDRYRKNHAENPEVKRERERKHHAKNPEVKRERGRKYHVEHRDQRRASHARRRARKREAIPPWFNDPVHKKLMAEHRDNKFVIAALLGVDPSELWEDHIIPLGLRDADGNMIGWHSADNLEWMIAAQNISKSNKYPYTYPTGTFNLVTRLSQRPTDPHTQDPREGDTWQL